MRIGLAVAAVVIAGCQSSGSTPRDQLRATGGALVIMKQADHDAGFLEYRDIARAAAGVAHVTRADPFMLSELIGSTATNHMALVVKGVEPRASSGLAPYLTAGALPHEPSRPPSIAVGAQLASWLHLGVGDPLDLQMPIIDRGDRSTVPRRETCTIVGTFRVGLDEVDERFAVIDLGVAQVLAGRGDQVTGIDVELDDPVHAAAVAQALRERLGPAYSVVSSYELARHALRIYPTP